MNQLAWTAPTRRATAGAACGDIPGVAARWTGDRSRTRRRDAASVRLRTAAVQEYFRAEHAAVQASAIGVFASSVPLAIYAATASARLRQLGVTAPGATIALAGGILAAGGLGLAGLVGWTLSRPDVAAEPTLVRALYYLVFLTGGPGHVVALGLLRGRYRGAQPHPRPAAQTGGVGRTCDRGASPK